MVLPALMRSRLLSLILAVSAVTALHGAEPTPEERFQWNVWPMLEHSCFRCHGAEKQKGDLRLDSREATLKGGKDGPALVPGKPAESLMVKLVRHAEEDREMPPKEKLQDVEIAALERWIADGAPWPAQPAATLGTNQEKIGDAWSDPRNPIVKIFGGKRLDLWSFKPITDPAPPPVRDTRWVQNPIDAFVLSRIEAAGLKPAAEADRRTLARRLYFDLTGLPPAPEEVEAFVSDPSPDAYKNLVDKLLDSPRYGEHWARLWLDTVRYSDSNGYDWDEFRPEAWRFRDYVIRSLNADKPFDRFIREQLAGDEMVPGDPQNTAEQDCLIATGYLRIGPFDNSAKKFGEDLRARTQVMSDLVETTGAAFLGLTLSCARCHNHKFDPVSQADYYRLRAFFEGIEPAEHIILDLPAPREEIRRHNEKLIAEIAEKQKFLEGIAAPYIERLRANRLERLPKEDRELLEHPPEKPDLAIRRKIFSLNKKMNPTMDQARRIFSEADTKLYDQTDAAYESLLEQGRNCTTGLLAHDAGDRPPATSVLFQGDFNQPREPVVPGYLSLLDPNPASIGKPARPSSSGRRSALAEWMVSEKNPLTSRVLVNRIWRAHFGEGLQATPNEFGHAGARPSQPDLLDWLAREFMRQGWSLKKMHRLMLNSATYKQGMQTSSIEEKHLPAGHAPHRLAAEALRDSMLSVAGKLQPHEGGPPLWPTLPADVLSASPALLDDAEFPMKGWHPSPPEKLNVRSIYLVQKRNLRIPMMETFDLPDNSISCPGRTVSTVAPQALTLLNNDFAIEMSQAFAQRLQREAGDTPDAQINRAFALALQRQPDAEERTSCLNFLKGHSLPELCRSLMNLNEFAYID